MTMRKVIQVSGFAVLILSLYVAGYVIWRGPAMREQCDHPKIVMLRNGITATVFRPLIEADRNMNQFTTEIYLID